MPYVRWKLKDFAKSHGLTAYVIAKQMVRSSDEGRPATVYRLLSDNPPARVDLSTLSALISALRELVPETRVEVGDVLEYVLEVEPKGKVSARRKPVKAGDPSEGKPVEPDDEEAAF